MQQLSSRIAEVRKDILEAKSGATNNPNNEQLYLAYQQQLAGLQQQLAALEQQQVLQGRTMGRRTTAESEEQDFPITDVYLEMATSFVDAALRMETLPELVPGTLVGAPGNGKWPLGDPSAPLRAYVRPEYPPLLKALMDALPTVSAQGSERSATIMSVLGSQGVGKTMFINLLLMRLLADGRKVFVQRTIKQHQGQGIPFFWWWDGERTGHTYREKAAHRYLQPGMVVVVDGGPPMGCLQDASAHRAQHVIVSVSPRVGLPLHIRGMPGYAATQCYWLPPWSEAEVLQYHRLVPSRQQEEEVLARFGLVGGVARFIFGPCSRDELLARQLEAVKLCSPRLLADVEASLQSGGWPDHGERLILLDVDNVPNDAAPAAPAAAAGGGVGAVAAAAGAAAGAGGAAAAAGAAAAGGAPVGAGAATAAQAGAAPTGGTPASGASTSATPAATAAAAATIQRGFARFASHHVMQAFMAARAQHEYGSILRFVTAGRRWGELGTLRGHMWEDLFCAHARMGFEGLRRKLKPSGSRTAPAMPDEHFRLNDCSPVVFTSLPQLRALVSKLHTVPRRWLPGSIQQPAYETEIYIPSWKNLAAVDALQLRPAGRAAGEVTLVTFQATVAATHDISGKGLKALLDILSRAVNIVGIEHHFVVPEAQYKGGYRMQQAITDGVEPLTWGRHVVPVEQYVVKLEPVKRLWG